MLGIAEIVVDEQGTRFTRRCDALSSALENSLKTWIPAACDLVNPDGRASFYVPLDERTIAVGTTMRIAAENFGAPASSTSRVILLTCATVETYSNNPAMLAYCCLSDGCLNNASSGEMVLSRLRRARPPFDPQSWGLAESSLDLPAIVRAVEIHGRVAIANDKFPLRVLAKLYAGIKELKRLKFSFAYGMNVDSNRPFHFQIATCHRPGFRDSALQTGVRFFGGSELLPAGSHRR